MNPYMNENDEMFTDLMNTAMEHLFNKIPREAHIDRSAIAADIANAARQIVMNNLPDYIRE